MKLHDEIARIAYELYERRGRIEGFELDNWLEAEKIVMVRHREQEKVIAKSPSSPRKKASTTKKINRRQKHERLKNNLQK